MNLPNGIIEASHSPADFVKQPPGTKGYFVVERGEVSKVSNLLTSYMAKSKLAAGKKLRTRSFIGFESKTNDPTYVIFAELEGVGK